MNKPNEPLILELEEVPSPAPAPSTALATTDNSPMSRMLAALDHGANLDQIERMMSLQERWEANEARKAYHAAFAAFKAEAVRIIKNRSVTDGPLKGKAYAELFSVVDAVTPALSRQGLSAAWKLTKDERDWIEVTCTLTHVQGHSESVSMGGPPDAGGAKNAIQARASSKSYLERYTLKAICGVAESGDDDDGNGAKRSADWLARVDEAKTEEELRQISREGSKAFTDRKDVPGYAAFMKAVQKRGAAIKGGGNA